MQESAGRRNFLTRMAALGLISHSRLALALDGGAPVTGADWVDQAPWPTLRAILAHLWPAGAGMPGADELHAIDYLHETLEHPAADADAKTRIVAGAARTEALAWERFGRAFAALAEADRESVLRQIENERGGQRWLSLLLTFLVEGLLADPVYGGNFEQRGWRWLRHPPGFPRPPADRTWYRLADPVYRQMKST